MWSKCQLSEGRWKPTRDLIYGAHRQTPSNTIEIFALRLADKQQHSACSKGADRKATDKSQVESPFATRSGWPTRRRQRKRAQTIFKPTNPKTKTKVWTSNRSVALALRRSSKFINVSPLSTDIDHVFLPFPVFPASSSASRFKRRLGFFANFFVSNFAKLRLLASSLPIFPVLLVFVPKYCLHFVH